MLRAGVFKNEKTAEEQVVQVLNFDIHLVKDYRGNRYIERITECVPIENKNEYTFDHRNEKTLEGKFDKFFDNATIFFSKTTNRELYKYQNVLEFVDDKYVLSNPISDANIREMRINMNDDDQVAFDSFLERNWGIKPPKMVKYDENGNEILPETKVQEKNSEEEKHKEIAKKFAETFGNEAKKAIGEKPEVKQEINVNNKAFAPKQENENKNNARRIIKNFGLQRKNVEDKSTLEHTKDSKNLGGSNFEANIDNNSNDNK
jgi:hypothetical protein